MRFLKFLVIIAFFVLTMALFAQNMEALTAPLPLTLHLLGADLFAFQYPVYMLLLMAFFLGAVITLAYFVCEKMRQGRELSQTRKKVSTLEQEVNSLRNLPLTESVSAEGGETADNQA